MISSLRVFLCTLTLQDSRGHGFTTYPPNRGGGNLSSAGKVDDYYPQSPQSWFTQPTTIPGWPTLNKSMYRTINVDVVGGLDDWTKTFPWRAPGTAPVLGSGCGVAGGSGFPIPNGGDTPTGYMAGDDGLKLPENVPTIWAQGEVVEAAWSITANHGGGYSWRLCKKTDKITEECFQQNALKFHGNVSWIQFVDRIPNREGYLKIPRFEIPLVKVSEGTYPPGSEWARNPIPSCKYCDQGATCGHEELNMTDWFYLSGEPGTPEGWYVGGEKWWKHEQCAQDCSGLGMMQCLPGMTQFKEPLPGISGFIGPKMVNYQSNETYPSSVGFQGLPWSVVDKLIIPSDTETGDYLLSFRWDCEQTPQIWQTCADIKIVQSNVHV